MGEQLTKFLYIGVAVLLTVAALTFFFSSYGDYQAYIERSGDFVKKDDIIARSDQSPEVMYQGSEVITFILEKRRQDEAALLSTVYGSSSQPASSQLPAIRVDAVDYQVMDLGTIQMDRNYLLNYQTDNQGKVTGMDFTGR